MKVIETMNYQIEQDKDTGKWCVYKVEDGSKLYEFDTRMEAMKQLKQLLADESLDKKDESKKADDKEIDANGADDDQA